MTEQTERCERDPLIHYLLTRPTIPSGGSDGPDTDPYDEPIFIRSHVPRLSHMHAEPVCAFPECETYLTREDMAAMRAQSDA